MESCRREPGNLLLEGFWVIYCFLKSRQCEVSGKSCGIDPVFASGGCRGTALVSAAGEVLWSHAAQSNENLWISDATDVRDLSRKELIGNLWPWPLERRPGY